MATQHKRHVVLGAEAEAASDGETEDLVTDRGQPPIRPVSAAKLARHARPIVGRNLVAFVAVLCIVSLVSVAIGFFLSGNGQELKAALATCDAEVTALHERFPRNDLEDQVQALREKLAIKEARIEKLELEAENNSLRTQLAMKGSEHHEAKQDEKHVEHDCTSLKKQLEHTEDSELKKIWWDLAQQLSQKKLFKRLGTSPLRKSLDLWSQATAKDLAKSGASNKHCAEFGDGHFLKRDYSKICTSQLVADIDIKGKKDAIQVDLTKLPSVVKAKSYEQAQGTIDILVCHQVFEHILKPTIGAFHLNMLMKIGGRLLFSTPFAFFDHQNPTDYFRYTVMNVQALLECAGFEIKEVGGLGNSLTIMAYIAGVATNDVAPSDLSSKCDRHHCKWQAYMGVVAIGQKTRDVTYEEVRQCYG